MEYLVILLEGIITFISPCILPMLPIYISYFAGKNDNKKNNISAVINSLSFVAGFTTIFVLLGALSASLGNLVKTHIRVIDIVLGIIIMIFGINYMDIIPIPFINKTKGLGLKNRAASVISSFVFGAMFSITWSPCIGAFLGTALSIILVNGNILRGVLLIITYCLGLGIPFVISTILINKMKNVFLFIKGHYKVINRICGIFLCVIGVLMITGLIDKYFNLMV